MSGGRAGAMWSGVKMTSGKGRHGSEGGDCVLSVLHVLHVVRKLSALPRGGRKAVEGKVGPQVEDWVGE